MLIGEKRRQEKIHIVQREREEKGSERGDRR